jgi:hypothetical protein
VDGLVIIIVVEEGEWVMGGGGVMCARCWPKGKDTTRCETNHPPSTIYDNLIICLLVGGE